jgi:uncharacterized membrane protein
MPDPGVGDLVIWLITVAVIVAIGALMVAGGLHIVGFRGADPRETLRKRLARGEITQAEFEDATRILGH